VVVERLVAAGCDEVEVERFTEVLVDCLVVPELAGLPEVLLVAD